MLDVLQEPLLSIVSQIEDAVEKAEIEESIRQRHAKLLSPVARGYFGYFNVHDRSTHRIHDRSHPIVSLAMDTLGVEEVFEISFSYGDARVIFNSDNQDEYLNALKSRLGEAYLQDTSKTHLRQYVDDTFGADLGL